MSLEFLPVRNTTQIRQVADMADEIWHEYWPSIIGNDQTDYMVDTFQSFEALRTDIKEKGFEYWILIDKGCVVGYTGGRCEIETSRFFISKVYLYANERGKGFASEVFAFYEDLCRKQDFKSIYLSVNKSNEMGLRAYRGKGFKEVKAVLIDIGKGFFMDDYIMEKTI